MTTKTISGTYTTYTLAKNYVTLDLTSTCTISTGVYAARLGQVTINNSGIIEGNSASNIGVSLNAGGTVTNGTTSLYTADIGGQVILGTSGVAALVVWNYGTITSNKGAGVYLDSSSTKFSSVTNGSATDAHNARLLINGATDGVLMNAPASRVTNYGVIEGVEFGVSIMSANSTLTNFGTIDGTAGTAVNFTGANDLLVVETGSVLVGMANGGGGTLELAAAYGTITNLGAIGTISGYETGTINSFGTYVVDRGTYWTLTGTEDVSANKTITDNGILLSAGSLTERGSITGSGTLEVIGGTANLQGYVGVSTLVRGGAANIAGQVADLAIYGGTANVSGQVAYLAVYGGTANISGQVANLTVYGGTANISGPVTVGTFADTTPGILAVGAQGTLTVSSTINFSGQLVGAGTIVIDGTGAVGGCAISGSAELIDNGAVTQSSAVSVGGGSATIPSLLINGTWTIINVTNILIENASSFIQVDGNFICDIPSAIQGADKITTPIVLNGGTITARKGALILENSVTATGSGYLYIGTIATASLEVDSLVSSGMQVFYGALGGVLEIGKYAVASFGAKINNFLPGDTIDLLRTVANSAILNGNSLVIKNDARTVATLQLFGNQGSAFLTAKDGHGGTYITLALDAIAPVPNAPPQAQAPSAQLMTMAMAGMCSPSGLSVPAHDPVSIRQWTLTGPRTQLA